MPGFTSRKETDCVAILSLGYVDVTYEAIMRCKYAMQQLGTGSVVECDCVICAAIVCVKQEAWLPWVCGCVSHVGQCALP